MSFRNPTPTEARQILKSLELSGEKVAEQCGMKNSRLVRKYTSEKMNQGMPYSVLFTLVAKNLGVFITVNNWRKELIEENVIQKEKEKYHSTPESEIQNNYNS